jgi:endonuclease YncB( thermonuclease family)
MGKPWKPGKSTVALNTAGRPLARPSRIRREPVQINANVPVKPQRPLNYRERELYLGIAGILIFAALIVVGITAFAIFTVVRDDPAADARAAEFTQCYNAQGPNCVLDGGTFYLAGQRVEIAGIETPGILDAKCDREHDRGVDAATQLALLLNSGPVTVGPTFRDQSGRTVRKVEVKGSDLAVKMIGRDLAHEAGSGLSWC